MPATISKELLTGLLRGQLGFNGLIITDATHMVGLTSKMKRSEFVPYVIEAGCDMVLYYRDKDEDVENFKAGLESGLLSRERFDEALTRVLAMKAMLKLHRKQKEGTLMPPKEELSVIGCQEHRKKANEIIDNAITLVKNTRNQLPLTPETHKRIMLYSIDSTPAVMRSMMGGGQDTAESMMKEYLEEAGFSVTVFTPEGKNGKQLLAGTPVKAFVSQFDAVILVANVSGFSQSNERRLHWSMPMGPDIPWYVHEVPTIFISLASPFHLADVPQVKTYINCYDKNEHTLDALVEKLLGRSEFAGTDPVDSFCGMMDTRI